MKKYFWYVTVLCSIFITKAIGIDQSVQKRLVLHFDVNKTIIASDVVQGKDLAQTVNGILAEFTFAAWDGKTIQSYYAYVSNQITQGRPDLHRSSEAFKRERNNRLQLFPIYLNMGWRWACSLFPTC